MEGGKVNLLIPTPNAQQKVGFNQDRCVCVYTQACVCVRVCTCHVQCSLCIAVPMHIISMNFHGGVGEE